MKDVSARGLSFSYQNKEVLKDISFDAAKGDYVGIVGPNGSGKTTLVKLILGLLKPTRGSVSLFEKPVGDITEWAKVGYLPQSSSFNPQFPVNVSEMVALGLLCRKSVHRSLDSSDRESIKKALSLLGIAALGCKMMGEL